MSAIAHPYRTALEARDPMGLAATLHPDVVFHTPAFDTPIHGRDRVLQLFAVLATVFDDARITDELAGDGTHSVAFRLRVDGKPIEGIDYLELTEDGLVRSIRVFMRPLASLQALAERVADVHAELTEPDA
jgi:ketosteroid isomerase-like protein